MSQFDRNAFLREFIEERLTWDRDYAPLLIVSKNFMEFIPAEMTFQEPEGLYWLSVPGLIPVEIRVVQHMNSHVNWCLC